MTHRAVVVDAPGTRGTVQRRRIRAPERGEVLIAVGHTSLNYKDALAVAGRPGVLRRTPLVPGIDAVGAVLADPDAPERAGETVVVTGAGLGEQVDGGLAEQVLAPRAVATGLPEAFTPGEAAAIGTAGFTAALAVIALERHGLPEGPVLVTGAGGGVGGFAVALLAARGREVVAASGRSGALADHLRALGAAAVVDRLPDAHDRPLQHGRWAGVVDAVGGGPLASALAQTAPRGAVAACGLAGGAALPGSVLPFILRGVALLGIDSVGVPRADRTAAWRLLAGYLEPAQVARMVDRTIDLAEVPDTADEVLEGRIRGRVLVRVASRVP